MKVVSYLISALRSTIVRFVCVLAVVSLVLMPLSGAAQIVSPKKREYQIKAAFLYNFLKFVEWPASAVSAGDPVRICIMGEDPFEEALTPLENKTIKQHTIEIIRFESGYSIIPQCSLLFVTESKADEMDDIIEFLKPYPILAVSDIEGFARKGGVIGFVERDGKIRFEINTSAAQERGFQVSSKILELAIILH